MKKLSYISLFLFLIAGTDAWAQPIPVDDVRSEQYRLIQMLANEPLRGSLMNQPLWYSSYEEAVFDSQSFLSGLIRCGVQKSDMGSRLLGDSSWWNCPLPNREWQYFSDQLAVGVYDPIVTNTWNSDLPHGENNGAAWYGKGLNSEFQGGLYANYDNLTVTFRPHVAWQQNQFFPIPRFIPFGPDGVRYVAEGYLPEGNLGDRIDRPFRFGPDAYWTFDLGQSSVRAHYGSFEVGLSNESLWWGPGKQYALVMSNNAPGVGHLFLGTRSPVALPGDLGDLEFRWIWGWPRESKYFDPSDVYRDDRFMNGLNVIYSPSFLPGLHLGTSRVIHQYRGDGLTLKDYLGVFRPFPRPEEVQIGDNRDESHFIEVNPMASYYFRWVFAESDAEIYGELYKENHNWNLRDFITEPQHGRGYTLGAQKILRSSSRWLDFVNISAEINSLLPNRIDDVRPQPYYYSHIYVRQGHTNNGQVLGAAIGPGSTSQYIGVDGYFRRGMLGLFIQRMVDNDQFHYEYYKRFWPGGGYKDLLHHRVNLNIGLKGRYIVGPVILNAKAVWNKQFNYGRFNYGETSHISWDSRPKDDVVNLHFQLGVRYLF